MHSHYSIFEAFSAVPDPRYSLPDYPLNEIIFVTLCATISGADDWTSISCWGTERLSWLQRFLPFNRGVPSHDTFGRVFAMIRADAFEQAFINWVKKLCPDLDISAIAIDGKTICRSHDRYLGKKAIHMVSAFAPGIGITLGQVRTAEKSNEITAIPELLALLEIKGCLVSIDAMGNQKAIAEKIHKQGGDYLLAVKGNQGLQHEAIVDYFATAQSNDFAGVKYTVDETIDKGHGRLERRRCWVVGDVEQLPSASRWSGMKTLVMVQSERHIGDSVSRESRYYVSSRESDAKYFNARVRHHWGIENRLHWNLDVSFREDDSRVRIGNAAENLSVLRRFALNLLRLDSKTKLGIKNKRKKAGWSMTYLSNLLNLEKV